MRKFFSLLIVLACTFSMPAMAGWSTAADVDQINIGTNGTHSTFVSLVGYSFTGCSSTTGGLLDGNNVNYKEFIATLLGAKLAQRSVKVLSTGCSGGYSLIQEVVML